MGEMHQSNDQLNGELGRVTQGYEEVQDTLAGYNNWGVEKLL